MSDKVYKFIAQLPDNSLTQPLKEKMMEKLEEGVQSGMQEVQQMNWQLAMLYQQLKEIEEAPSTSDEQRAEMQKIERRVAAKLEDIQTRLQKIRENHQND